MICRYLSSKSTTSLRKLIYQWQFPSFSTPAAPRRQLLPGLATTSRLPPRRLLPGLATTPPPPLPRRPQLLPGLANPSTSTSTTTASPPIMHTTSTTSHP
ncbi:hypothetical protein Pcinc_043767 [Petrolisthes cinctipes]|uniref:Uncharacterized protein n=1 Tax=Petrolisthes cinctipes TaxID=88211 RepID=A0AAE1BFZ7_PETCI|nr:hypothetical protein Pcinc_043767 [Petrolisthes cinctipes]